MKKFITYSTLLLSLVCSAQVASYNQFPAIQPTHILDENLDNISFAFSLRILASEYVGPLIRLRRASDNAEMDFFCKDDDKVDVDAINTWRNESNLFVVIWYDQSGLDRNAVQNTRNRQPRFHPDATRPYFQGDGINDFLSVDTPNGIQDVTNNGNQGTVLAILKATTKSQHTFGVLTNSNRWSAHVNWSNNRTYFDPGICCNATRSFYNAANVNVWEQYTFIKTNTNAIARSGGTQHFNGAHTTGRCTRTEDFAICWATGNGTNNYSNVSFMEFVMYRTDISQYDEIENNIQTFWNL